MKEQSICIRCGADDVGIYYPEIYCKPCKAEMKRMNSDHDWVRPKRRKKANVPVTTPRRIPSVHQTKIH